MFHITSFLFELNTQSSLERKAFPSPIMTDFCSVLTNFVFLNGFCELYRKILQ